MLSTGVDVMTEGQLMDSSHPLKLRPIKQPELRRRKLNESLDRCSDCTRRCGKLCAAVEESHAQTIRSRLRTSLVSPDASSGERSNARRGRDVVLLTTNRGRVILEIA